MMPFAHNESTRFISPTKTPEYLSAGLHVISTPIRDVVTPYGQLGLVSIAQNADEFIAAAEKSLKVLRARRGKAMCKSSWTRCLGTVHGPPWTS